MSLLPRTLGMPNIAPDLLKIMATLVVAKSLVDLPGIDVVERDTFQDVFGSVIEDDDHGVVHLLHHFPAWTHQTTWWQRDNAIPTLFKGKNVLKGLRDIAPETIGAKMAILETLNRGPEKSLGLRIQIVKPPLEEVGQS